MAAVSTIPYYSGPWYPLVYGSEETAVEENSCMLRHMEFSAVLQVLDLFFFKASPLPPKTGCLSTDLKCSFYHFY
jgi:hypothetical protein